jgi:hypothetical protein
MIVAALLAWPRPAFAQPSPETLRAQLVAQASNARDHGQHAEAARLLRAALSIRSSPGTRWALAFELHLQGEFQAAAHEAETCIEEASGAGPDAATARDECEAIRVRARDRIQAEDVRVANAAGTGAGGPPARATTTPTTRATAASSTPHPVAATTTPTIPAAPTTRAVGPGPAILVSAGGAALLTTAVLWGLRASQLASCSRGGETLYCQTQDDLDAARGGASYTTAGWVTLGVGVAAIGAGTLWWLLGRRAHEAPISVAVGTSGVTVEGRF